MIISKFEQTDHNLRVGLSGLTGDKLWVVQCPVVPETINPETLANSDFWKKAFPISNGLSDVLINFKDYVEPNNAEYSLIFITDGEDSLKRPFNYCEVVRQSESWLRDSFGFYRGGGYCIEGRSSLQHSRPLTVKKLPPVIFFGTERPAIHPSYVKDVNILENRTAKPFLNFPEIRKAKEILKYLVALQLNTGPVHNNHSEYHSASLDRRLEMLISGDYAVQCSGFRDLFVWIYKDSGFKIRNIDANCTVSRFKDLISYGHSLCEIFIKAIDRWVIFDPWFGGVMLLDEDGLVGLDGLATRSVNGDKYFSLSSVIKTYDRHVMHTASGKTFYAYDIDNLYLHNYYFSEQLGSCMPGYLDYFKFVRIHSVHVAPMFSRIPVRFFAKGINRLYSLVH